MARKLTGSLRQLRSGRWEASVPLHTGSRHRIYATFDTQLQADAWRSAQLLKVADGGTASKPETDQLGPTDQLSPASNPEQVADLLVETMDAARKPGPSRRRDIAADLRNHVLPYLQHVGVTRIGQLTVWHLKHDLPLWLAGTGRYDGRDASQLVEKSTARNVLQAARRLTQYAVDMQILAIQVPEKIAAVERRGKVSATDSEEQDKPAPELVDCRRVAGHLHVIHQIAFWLMRIGGLRIGEAYGLRVGSYEPRGDFGILWVREQGGANYLVDDDGGTGTASSVRRVKTPASRRPVAVPPSLMAMLDVVVAAFHTDDDGTIRPDARLVPGLRRADEGGQQAFRDALDNAIAAASRHGSVIPRFTPHDLRSGAITDLTLHVDSEQYHQHIQRQHGHQRGDDVTSRSYIRDVSLEHVRNVERVRAVVAGLQQAIDDQLDGNLMIPTAKTPEGGTATAPHLRWDEAVEILHEHGWQLDANRIDGYWATSRIAQGCAVAETTARRWLREGTIPAVFVDGQYLAQPADVERHRQIEQTHVSVEDLAREVDKDYPHVYATMRRLGVSGAMRRGRYELLAPDDADRLRAEYNRVRRLHERAMRQSEAARVLGESQRTVRGWVARGQKLEIDPETDGSGAKFVTRESVAALQQPSGSAATIAMSEVARRLGVTVRQAAGLVERGLLQSQLVQRKREVLAESLDRYIATYRPELLDG